MAQKGLSGFFENFLKKESLFVDKKVLQSTYMPDSVIHRADQMKQIAEVIAPALKMDKPSNIFIYGKSGTGKTLTVKHTSNEIMNVANKNKIPLRIFYLNCKLKKIADTEYRLVAQLAREFGKTIPATGLPTDEVYKAFFSAIDNKKQIVLLVLDEIDELVKKTGDEILYNLSRINEDLKNCQLSIIGISNNLTFGDNIDPRVKSSLSEEELIFPPYNALQIHEILQHRARKAFKENVVGEGVIGKCAAYAAREHGDARRALELLRVAGEIAERNNHSQILTEHIDLADEKIDKDKMVELLTSQPRQFQSILYSIVSIHLSRKSQTIFTGEVYEVYKNVCSQTNLRPLTQRRVSDIISELDMLGMITARVISKGRYGRTREIILSTPKSSNQKIKRILEEALGL